MSLDDLPTGAPQRPVPEAETVVRRVTAPHPIRTRSRAPRSCVCSLPMKSCAARCRRAQRSTRPTSRGASTCRARGREALRSSGSGLVDTRAHRGAVVARPSIERLTGMFEAMAELEALCAGLAAERMLPIERHRLEAVHEGIAGAELCRQSGPVSRSQRALHNAIYAARRTAISPK